MTLGGSPAHWRVDDDLHVADVGQRIERHVRHAPDAGDREQNGARENQERIACAPCDGSCNHHMPPVALTLSCLVAIVCAAALDRDGHLPGAACVELQ